VVHAVFHCQVYDLVVIGSGSGGLACAKRAASYGVSVALIEGSTKFAGTCVNVGCVPKKIMYNAAQVYRTVHEADNFGISINGQIDFDWTILKHTRDRHIDRLASIHAHSIEKLMIDRIIGWASLVDHETVKIITRSSQDSIEESSEMLIKGKHILIAVGGRPSSLKIPGAEHIIDSDGFFHLENQPKKVGIIGAGYIAVELTSILNGLGSDVSVFCREDQVLRNFDPMISTAFTQSLTESGNPVS
jgi:glutathione reductase (NADPH)